MIRLSIVIATFNRGGKLAGTLRSLAGQTLSPDEWEAVVVNNNSTDDTTEVFAGFADGEGRGLNVRMVSESRQGLSWARNHGIEVARGEIVAIIDDDEEVNPGFAAAYLDFFDCHPQVVIAGGKVVPLYETGRPRWMSRFTERPIAGTLDLGPRERPFTRGYPAGGNMALRRHAFEKYGAFDTALGRTGGALTGGEEKELFGRITSGRDIEGRVVGRGGEAWWVPDAVIRHIIPSEKLTLDYMRRLARGVGSSERVRTKAISGGAYFGAIAGEVCKWGATLVIALWFVLSLRPSKARYLIIMRRWITAGLMSEKRGVLA